MRSSVPLASQFLVNEKNVIFVMNGILIMWCSHIDVVVRMYVVIHMTGYVRTLVTHMAHIACACIRMVTACTKIEVPECCANFEKILLLL